MQKGSSISVVTASASVDPNGPFKDTGGIENTDAIFVVIATSIKTEAKCGRKTHRKCQGK